MPRRFARVPGRRFQFRPSWFAEYFSLFRPPGTCCFARCLDPRRLISCHSGDTTFNSLPSNRHADLTPALAFVNYFCEVASLEPDIVPDIINIKRQVLSMLQVKEFSPIARFENPAPKLVLPAVFCPYCSHGQDIDLCRDHGALSKNWKCVLCLLVDLCAEQIRSSNPLTGASIAAILSISTLCTACCLKASDGSFFYLKLR